MLVMLGSTVAAATQAITVTAAFHGDPSRTGAHSGASGADGDRHEDDGERRQRQRPPDRVAERVGVGLKPGQARKPEALGDDLYHEEVADRDDPPIGRARHPDQRRRTGKAERAHDPVADEHVAPAGDGNGADRLVAGALERPAAA